MSGSAENTSTGNLGLFIGRDIFSWLAFRFSYTNAQDTRSASYRFIPASHNPHPDQAGEITFNTEIRNHETGLGLQAYKSFRKVRVYFESDILFTSSRYSITTDGLFTGFDTTGTPVPVSKKINEQITLSHDGPGFRSQAGLTFFLGKHFGIDANVAFVRVVMSGYEGSGNFSKLENVLAGTSHLPDGGPDGYFFSAGKNVLGQEVYFFERKSNVNGANPLAKDLTDRHGTSVDFSGVSGKIGLIFRF
jgi:hypothetical protein